MSSVVTHEVTVVCSDGEEFTLGCRNNTPILDEMADAGLVLKSACHAGGCGSCTATVRAGTVSMSDHDEEVVDPPEEEGGVLLCVGSAQSPCTIDVDYKGSSVSRVPAKRRQTQIGQREQLPDGTWRVVANLLPGPDGSNAAETQPGQSFIFSSATGIASPPLQCASISNWTGELEFYISGAHNAWLAELSGDCTVEGPLGKPVLAEHGLRPRWLISDTYGLNTSMAIIRHMSEFADMQAVQVISPQLPQWAEEIMMMAPLMDCQPVHPEDITAHILEQVHEYHNQGTELPDLYISGSSAFCAQLSGALPESVQDRIIATCYTR